MSCERANALIEALLDGELDLHQQGEVEAHVEGCRACAEFMARRKRLGSAIHELSVEPDEALKERIIKSLRAEAKRSVRINYWFWAAAAASMLLGIAYAWNVSVRKPVAGGTELIAREVASSHVRSLMGNHLLDVPSTDQHTVKPWFAGKLDFSPSVKDFPGGGFRLIGGRLDYIGGHPAAALVYQHSQHIVNLFTWPDQRADAPPTVGVSLNGYRSVHWVESGMSYWAVGDVPESTLMELANLYIK